MILDYIKPDKSLSEFVSHYRIVEFIFSDDTAIPAKAYTPQPGHCLQFYPKDTETIEYPHHNLVVSNKRIVISGQQKATHYRLVRKNFLTFQIKFQPGALYRLTGIPASELSDSYLDAEEMLGNSIRMVNEQLYYADNPNQMIVIVEKYLQALVKRARLKTEHAIDRIGQWMVQQWQTTSLDWYAKEACLCYRQFDRKFKERLGITPKEFERIIRFDRAYRMRNHYPQKDWLSIALDCGYYDYQHLTKAFKAFTDKTPTEFYQLKGPERMFGEVDP